MQPRWEPSNGGPHMRFLGYANDLDVWSRDDPKLIIVVGPEEKRIGVGEDFNFDEFAVADGVLVLLAERVDLHIDVHDMCLIYALCVEHGLFKENENV